MRTSRVALRSGAASGFFAVAVWLIGASCSSVKDISEPSCTYAVTPNAAAFGATGGSAAVTVESAGVCAWNVSNPPAWLTFASGMSGAGSGTLTFSAAANPTTAPRSATFSVAGRTVTVSQSGSCSYAVAPTSASFGATGGTAVTSVATTAGCGWSATSPVEWIKVTAGGAGSGDGNVTYAVDPNVSTGSRVAVVNVAGQAVTVTEAGAEPVPPPTPTPAPTPTPEPTPDPTPTPTPTPPPTPTPEPAPTPPPSPSCSFTVTPTSASADAAGDTGTVRVSTGGNCAWTAASGTSWIHITTGGSGSGNGNVAYSVDPNTGTGPRVGTFSAAGRVVTITQAGAPPAPCSFTVSPTSATPAAGGGAADVSVTTSPTCGWTATSQVSWIAIASGTSGTGNGTVLYAVDSNPGQARTGTLTVAGKAVTVTQAAGSGAPPPPSCAYSLSRSTVSYDNKKHDDTVKVTTTNCGWTASTDASWITFPDAGSGTGTGTLHYTVAANGTKAERTGTITVNGQTLEVTQRK